MTKILTHPSFMLGIQYKGLLSDKICNQFCDLLIVILI
jgi:hypothetical protein